MTDIKKNQAGLSLGLLFAAMHALWIAAVGAGIGNTLLDWLHTAHFVSNPYTVTGIGAVTAVGGILGAFICGYVTGWAFALLWNWTGNQDIL